MLFPLKVGIGVTKSSNNIDSRCLVQSQTEQLFICRLVSCYHNFLVLQLFKLKVGFSLFQIFFKICNLNAWYSLRVTAFWSLGETKCFVHVFLCRLFFPPRLFHYSK